MFALSDRLGAVKNAKIIGISRLLLGCFVASLSALPVFLTIYAIVLKFFAKNPLAFSASSILGNFKGLANSTLLATIIIFPILTIFVFFLRKFTKDRAPLEAQKILLLAGTLFASTLTFLVLFAAVIITRNYDFNAISITALFVAPVGMFCAGIGHLVASKPTEGDIIRHNAKLLFAVFVPSITCWFMYYFFFYARDNFISNLLYGIRMRIYFLEDFKNVARYSIDNAVVIFPILLAIVYFLQKITFGKSEKWSQNAVLITGAVFAPLYHICYIFISHLVEKTPVAPMFIIEYIIPIDIVTGLFCAALGHLIFKFGEHKKDDKILFVLRVVFAIIVAGFFARAIYYVGYFAFMNFVGILKFHYVTGYPVYKDFIVFLHWSLRDTISSFWILSLFVFIIWQITKNKPPKIALYILLSGGALFAICAHGIDYVMSCLGGTCNPYYSSLSLVSFDIIAGVACAYIGHIIVNGLPKISKPQNNKDQNEMLLAQ